MEHLPDDRNLSRNTQQSYRDALRLLIVFAASKVRKKADRLLIADIDADLVRVFLRHLEEERGCTTSTRNQRLAAYHAFAAFVGQRSPEDLGWSAQLWSGSSNARHALPSAIWTNMKSMLCWPHPTAQRRLGIGIMCCYCSSTTLERVPIRPRNRR
jgi:site-specific recombinase XerD